MVMNGKNMEGDGCDLFNGIFRHSPEENKKTAKISGYPVPWRD
jgi:hypothetical protein